MYPCTHEKRVYSSTTLLPKKRILFNACEFEIHIMSIDDIKST